MHIIGTSGHVDHGKTALIQALTGINADRLPEEKKRGMTIDLGFAHFEGTGGETVGVIDVPGHERFIRNMVAGAWSLSCAVLVVAANEGWMQQTEDHARVLEAMGTERLICGLTKSDLVEKSTLPSVMEEVRTNLYRVFQKEITIIPVSSLTGEGIEDLKSEILTILQTIPQKKSRLSAYIHMDRVFTVKGSGTIITGSLSGGELCEGDELSILPGGKRVKVRGIQSYHSAVQTAYPVSRVACNLQGIKKEELSRGYIGAKNSSDFQIAREYIVQWEQTENPGKIRNHMELEMACGTGHYTGILHFLPPPGFGRIVLKTSVPALWLSPCLFIQQGGHRIIGKGRLIRAGETDRPFRIRLSSLLQEYPPDRVIEEESILMLLMNEWCTPPGENKDLLDAFVRDFKIPLRQIGTAIVLEKRFKQAQEKLKDLCSRPGGVSTVEVLHSRDLPEVVKKELIREKLDSGEIVLRGNILLTPEQLSAHTELSPLGEKILRMLSRQKNKGLQLKNIREEGAKTELRNLIRIGKIIELEEEIFFSSGYFYKLTHLILEGLETGDVFSIPEAKEKTGLSRRYVIPVLNKMESLGMVKRRGDNRVVC